MVKLAYFALIALLVYTKYTTLHISTNYIKFSAFKRIVNPITKEK